MHVVHVVLVEARVVDAVLQRAGWSGGVGQPVRLAHAVRDVDAEPVDAAVQPEPQRLLEVGPDLGVGPVQVRLLGGEQVQVPLARATVADGSRVQAGPPKTLRQLFGGCAPSAPRPGRKW